MGIIAYRIGPLDTATQGFPRDLFDPETGALLRPAGRMAPDFLPLSVVATAPWTPDAIRNGFADDGTIKKDLLDAGRAMYSWLDHGGISAEWAARRSAGDMTLLDVASSELNDLPWELLMQGNVPLFGTKPIARFHKSVMPAAPQEEWPLRVWIVNGAGKDVAVNAAAEIRQIRSDLLWHRHSIDIQIDGPAKIPDATTFGTLLGEFRPHVVHFIGHSGVSAISGLPALFVNAANPWELDATTISVAFENAKVTPRFVFLNACHTTDTRSDANAVAAAFSDAGVPSILTMQGAVEGDQAGKFAAELYKRLADGVSDVADAVRRARNVLDGGKPHHWAFPVLSLSGSPTGLLPVPPANLPQRFADIEPCRIFQQVRLFSGRADERRRLRTAICPITNPGKPRHLLIVVGDTQHGKSHLVKRCLECLTLRGHNAQYVEVADTGAKNQLNFLLDIFRRSDDGLLIPQLETAFKRFKWDALQILRGASKAWDGVTDTPEPIEFEPAQLKSENALGLLAQAALTALGGGATAAAPLLIVFDHFRLTTGELAVSEAIFNRFLWPSIFEPIHRAKVANLYVAMVFGRDDAEKVYRVQDRIGQEQWLPVEDFPAEEFDDLVDELLGYPEPATLSGMDQIAAGLKAHLGKTPTAGLLGTLVTVADSLKIGHRARVGRSK